MWKTSLVTLSTLYSIIKRSESCFILLRIPQQNIWSCYMLIISVLPRVCSSCVTSTINFKYSLKLYISLVSFLRWSQLIKASYGSREGFLSTCISSCAKQINLTKHAVINHWRTFISLLINMPWDGKLQKETPTNTSEMAESKRPRKRVSRKPNN